MSRPTCNTRRRLLLAAGGVALAGTAAGFAAARPLLMNECRAQLPADPAVQALLTAAWADLDPARVWDVHVHLAGTGDSGRGIELSERMQTPLRPFDYAQRLFYLNAGCAHRAPGQVDESYIARLQNLCADAPAGFKLMLFAFDRAYDEHGRVLPLEGSMYIPNDYASEVARRAPERFEWVCSIHPWRTNAVAQLQAAAEQGARAVKWLPPAMGIDPASPRCDAFYDALARLDLPLLTHVGEEKAVHGPGLPEWGNPLRLRRALERGVRVIAAHCGSLGSDVDTDRASRPRVPTFDLFARLMDDEAHASRLLGDVSAITLINRDPEVIRTIVERREWHERLLFGSDYPLPGIVPLIPLAKLVRERLLDAGAVPALDALRHHNPILFDFALKRQLASRGRRLPASVFETRRHFDRSVA
ncbi:amidohydrolase family protein [Azoarcus olearius]|uniref:Mannonate dehydratase n=1 Tax=Azoarcus sp. (strain BH72) TaxID=418699 RepID=A1K1R2_AZOSB|nr:amidohydrolase family protein [Azoarcus olearius]CAL92767.1 putative mannonate dehydratase [Azoarcus olearius]